VYATYYKEEIAGLVDSAKALLLEAGIEEKGITLHPAPGSFEVPLIGAELAASGKVDALMAFGIIVQGQTHHARLLAESVTHALMDIQIRQRMPFAFEILFVDDIAQARDRATGPDNKGREAAYAVLHSLAELHRIRTALS
jgi:6,7-dimethyl-8-ribityllumazine synthase